jgi:hypothetical protein
LASNAGSIVSQSLALLTLELYGIRSPKSFSDKIQSKLVYCRENELKRVDGDAGEVERAAGGRAVLDVVAEGAAFGTFFVVVIGVPDVDLLVLGEVKEVHRLVIRDEVGVDAGLEVDGRDLARVHEACLLDLLELLEEPDTCLVAHEGDEGDVERLPGVEPRGPGENLVVVHTIDESGLGGV